MKKQLYRTVLSLLMAFAGITPSHAAAWDFTTIIDDTDIANLDADPTNWTKDGKRWKFKPALTRGVLTANGQELHVTKGLLFTCTASGDSYRVGTEKRLWVSSSKSLIIIPDLKKGQTVTIKFKSSSSSAERTITPSNLDNISGFELTTADQTGTGMVSADGDVVLTPTGALYIYGIEVSESETGSTVVVPAEDVATQQDVVTHAVDRDTKVNQMHVVTLDGSIRYYNTADLDHVDLDQEHSTVTVTPKSGSDDVYRSSVRDIAFSKAAPQGEDAQIHNQGVVITESKGWLESAYVKWEPYNGATSYAVYVKGGSYASYTRIDEMLVRDYGSYGRADIIGLKAATDYELKVVPIIGGQEDESKASSASAIKVRNYIREGFAHKGFSGVGAYNDDGTLKSGAQVLYVTKNTAKTVTFDMITSSNGRTTRLTGLQAILEAYEKGYHSTPLAIRLIGKLTDSDLDAMGSSGEGLQVKGKAGKAMNLTIEGIGEDATIHGFGFLVRNVKSVEMRNLGIMKFKDDGISIDTKNENVWIHHIDMFYGKPGSDADQVKGDGSIDIKSDSKYITVDHCHFWDSGKSSLCGMKSESGPNYITYHHNWFDHSDSRHPRIRTMTVHVWNNYYDGVAKYGPGATYGASAFVESNYFRNTPKPILISMQGSDIISGKGTFSGENGGIIKSYGNVFAEKGSNFHYVTYQQDPVEFDAWEAAQRDDQVPSTVKAKQGGTTYNNFDTDPSLMYSYQAEPATQVPATVEGWYGAGRLNHGDFKWTFNNSTDDKDDGVNSDLDTAVTNYKPTVKGIFGGERLSE